MKELIAKMKLHAGRYTRIDWYSEQDLSFKKGPVAVWTRLSDYESDHESATPDYATLFLE